MGISSAYGAPASDPPAITALTPWQVSTIGTSAVFNVTATGTPPLAYQWSLNGTNLTNATSASLVITNVRPVNAGNYVVVVTNAFGAATSEVATLYVICLLKIGMTGTGTVTRAPNYQDYVLNSIIALTATPAPDYRFFDWSGDVSSSNNPVVITLTTNKTIQANFACTAVNPTIQGEGMVGKDPVKSSYELGDQVSLTATPQRWFAFTRWADGPTANPRTITIGLSNAYTAIFSPTTAVETLTFGGQTRIGPIGMPSLFVDGDFITTHGVTRLGAATVSIQTTFPNGTILYTRDGSKPGVFSSLYTGPIQVQRSATIRAIAYNADFTQFWESDPLALTIQPLYTFNAISSGGGEVTWSPTNGPYVDNTVISVVAQPVPGWTFLQWLGDLANGSASNQITVTRNTQLKAVFGTTVNSSVTGNGMVLVDPAAGFYPYGYRVRVTAVPQAGQGFVLWGNAVSSTNNPVFLTVTNANPTVSCLFVPLDTGQVTLTVVEYGLGSVQVLPRASRYSSGQTVTLTAIPEADQWFLGWGGDAAGTNGVTMMSLNQSKTVQAHFTKRPRLKLWPGARTDGNPEISILLDGVLGERFALEYSGNLNDWTLLTPVTNHWGSVQFFDATSRSAGQRYYRSRPMP